MQCNVLNLARSMVIHVIVARYNLYYYTAELAIRSARFVQTGKFWRKTCRADWKTNKPDSGTFYK